MAQTDSTQANDNHHADHSPGIAGSPLDRDAQDDVAAPIPHPDESDESAFWEGQHHLGVALHHLGQHERAIEILRICVAQNEGRIDWANQLGNILHGQGRFAEAAAVFNQAIEKAPHIAQLWINLGAAQDRLGDFTGAEKAYQGAIALQPLSQDAYQLLSALYAARNMELEAVRAYCAGYVVAPRETTTPYLLGKAFYVLGRLEEAAEVYRAWKEAEPDNPVPAHLFAACSGEEAAGVPDRCSEDYVNVTFDEYAGHFESKLGHLDYCGPAWLERLMAFHFEARGRLDVLDAGCGTGLCAPVLRPYAQSLTGVDLSGSMLDIARGRGLYDALHKFEIGAFLRDDRASYDLIACMDTLIYFGALKDIFDQFAARLKPGGWLVFTSERCASNNRSFQLNPSGRYSHSVSYLREVMEAAGFDCLVLEHETLRTEMQRPVPCVMALARRR